MPVAAIVTSVPEAVDSPQVPQVSSDSKEEFPALPTAAAEPATRPTPAQPPHMSKPPPAPPVTRKPTPSTKPVKVDPKKPALPPLATATLTRLTQSTEPSPLVELASAKTENKGKKAGTESATVATPVTPSVQPGTSTKGGKPSESTPAGTTKGNTTKSKEAKTPATPSSQTPVLMLPSEPVEHAPILARQTKKSKPQQLPKKKAVIVREESAGPKENTPEPQATASPAGVEASTGPPLVPSVTELGDLLDQLRDQMDPNSLRFFKESSLNPPEVSEYKPLVEPLALLSATRQHYVFYDEAPDEIDEGMVAVERLLHTVTKMVSDLLKLMPRNTPLDRAMWDIVKKEMTKAGFMTANHTLRDWGAALRAEDHPELEQKIEWLEDSLAELERYHNDINQASITEFLGSNDRGRGCTPHLPRVGGTCERYKMTGTCLRDGEEIGMTMSQLQAELAATKKEICSVSDELHEVMRNNARLIAEIM
ncbi:hypothetical protein M408DRAFT_133893 [Serendipita vermifera MAFF 305830]|uniref:Uncharacterized protein n=1 Tax=Serendipita vermifera MAFF 305830 TaxID=933852 RepID=A0A0C3AWD1_SERVB|nr:hypothetical protein M408DRAFT_133893 [Serendipita vermifera MAFF 305830]